MDSMERAAHEKKGRNRKRRWKEKNKRQRLACQESCRNPLASFAGVRPCVEMDGHGSRAKKHETRTVYAMTTNRANDKRKKPALPSMCKLTHTICHCAK